MRALKSFVDLVVSRLDAFNDRLGRLLAITPLLLVIVQFAIVVMVYVFAVGSIKLQESLQYINALMVMGAVGYTALNDAHVRVDIFYAKISEGKQDWVNLVGSVVLLLPTLTFLWIMAIPYVYQSVSVLEGSPETDGLALVYLLKSTILLFCLSLSVAVTSSIARLSAKKVCAYLAAQER